MGDEVFTTLMSAGSGALGVLISWLSFARKLRKEGEKDGEGKGSLASDIGYIKAGVDDLKRESRESRHDIAELSIRVARCEESCKQAHKRIDELHDRVELN